MERTWICRKIEIDSRRSAIQLTRTPRYLHSWQQLKTGSYSCLRSISVMGLFIYVLCYDELKNSVEMSIQLWSTKEVRGRTGSRVLRSMTWSKKTARNLYLWGFFNSEYFLHKGVGRFSSITDPLGCRIVHFHRSDKYCLFGSSANESALRNQC